MSDKGRMKELREKKADELAREGRDLRHQLSDLQLKVRMGTSRETTRLGKIRRDIARVLTIQNEARSHEKKA